MLALSALGNGCLVDQNIELPLLRQGVLKNMAIKYLSVIEYSRFFNQQIAHTFLFQMRYGGPLNPEKWSSDRQFGSANPCFWPTHSVML